MPAWAGLAIYPTFVIFSLTIFIDSGLRMVYIIHHIPVCR